MLGQETNPGLYKWLFIAEFEDGTVIKQDQEDKSKTKKKGSIFTDVLAYEKTSKLVFFTLEQVETHEMAYVDLGTGAFSINGTPFNAHEQNFDATSADLRLIYFRETRVERVVNAKNEQVDGRHYINRYFIGWQTTVHNKNHQATIAVG